VPASLGSSLHSPATWPSNCKTTQTVSRWWTWLEKFLISRPSITPQVRAECLAVVLQQLGRVHLQRLWRELFWQQLRLLYTTRRKHPKAVDNGWWNRIPPLTLLTSELSTGRGQFDTAELPVDPAELLGSTSMPVFEMSGSQKKIANPTHRREIGGRSGTR